MVEYALNRQCVHFRTSAIVSHTHSLHCCLYMSSSYKRIYSNHIQITTRFSILFFSTAIWQHRRCSSIYILRVFEFWASSQAHIYYVYNICKESTDAIGRYFRRFFFVCIIILKNLVTCMTYIALLICHVYEYISMYSLSIHYGMQSMNVGSQWISAEWEKASKYMYYSIE